jgi:tartrate dehydratase alpha subunit/fumarate hydratase class I-like protein
VHLVGGDFDDAVDEGVRRGYGDGYLRKSVAEEPAHARRNTKDNTPAILHTSIVPGDKVRLTMMAKGGGAENMSSLNMLKPSQGWDGMVKAVVDTVSRAGSNPCPPVIIGVGIGGTIDMVTVLAKKALLREVGSAHADPRIAREDQRARHRAAGPGRQHHRPRRVHRRDARPHRQHAGGRQRAVSRAAAQDRRTLKEEGSWPPRRSRLLSATRSSAT